MGVQDAAGPAWRDYGEIILVDTDEATPQCQAADSDSVHCLQELVKYGDLICSEHTQIMHKDPK